MQRMLRSIFAIALVIGSAACAKPPLVPPPRPPVAPSFEQKMSWILRFEDQRVLRDPLPTPVEPDPLAAVASAQLPPAAPDLLRLLGDEEARIRRRAALAAGRVGLAEAVTPLVALLEDSEPEVRRVAAFALGLIGDRAALDPLVAALADPDLQVQGSVAEALGLLGDPAAGSALGALAKSIVDADLTVEEADDASRDTPAAVLRLSVYALARLKAFEPLAAAVLDATGQPRVRWWPIAYALQRVEDPRAVPALVALAGDSHPYTRAFAVKGLGALKDRAAVPVLLSLVESPDRAVAIGAVRALGLIGDPVAGPAILRLAETPGGDPALRLEAVSAVALLTFETPPPALLDWLSDPSPLVRAAAIKALATLDPEGFVFVLSGLDPDPHWTVRSALATALGALTGEAQLPRLRVLLDDPDQRVVPAVLAALVRANPPDLAEILLRRLEVDDVVVRAAAASALGGLRPPAGAQALQEAYRFGQRDLTYLARAAALAALAGYGAETAMPVLDEALADKDWAVRVRAAALIAELDPRIDPDVRIRPAPSHPQEFYAAPRVISPPFSTQAFIDTDYGSIQIELAVLDAPLTSENFVALARRGFFNGVPFHRVVPDFVVQAGDPRGDGEGGPGYTIRDELNERPYLRGTVGMALDWEDTGGSQFFITLSPQPHLDGRYTVFGRVVSGMEIVDRIQPGDVIHRIRVWDGETMSARALGNARENPAGN